MKNEDLLPMIHELPLYVQLTINREIDSFSPEIEESFTPEASSLKVNKKAKSRPKNILYLKTSIEPIDADGIQCKHNLLV